MMKRLVFAIALFACACAPPAQQATTASSASAARAEALRERDGRLCTEDRVWCVRSADDSRDETLTAVTYDSGGAIRDVAVFRFDKTHSHGVWPRILRLADGSVIVGLTTRREDVYSGGGGYQTDVALFRFEPSDSFTEDDMPEPVAALPLAAEFSVRACFDAEDEAARRGTCTDDYGFDADITLEQDATESPPPLVIVAEATTYPGRRSRSTDSTGQPPLNADDLVTVRDPGCSYRRTLYWRGDRYVPDQPLPACEDYKTQ